jgi:hypothetical protein
MSIPRLNLTKKSTVYPAVVLDGQYGQTIEVDLYKVDLVHEYIMNVVEGTLNGGTSPAWTVSATNPIITHVSIYADNEPIFDSDYQLFMEEAKLFRNYAPNGLNGMLAMGVQDLSQKGKVFTLTAFPSYKFSQIKMKLTIAPLANITSGSPTSTTGTTLYLQEQVTPYAAIPRPNGKLMPVMQTKKLQISSPLSLSGINDLTEFLSKDGAYAYILFASMTGSAVNYSNLSNSIISEMKLEINNSVTKFDDYFSILQAEDQAILHNTPDAGYAVKIFSEDGAYSDFLDLTPNDLKRVDLKVTTSSSGNTLAALKTEVFPVLLS